MNGKQSQADGGLICLECKGELTPDSTFCPHCQCAVLRRYCPGCSKLVPDATLYCPYCGTAANEKPKRRIPISPNAVAATVGVIAMIAIIGWSGSGQKDPSQEQAAKPTTTAAPVGSQSVASMAKPPKPQPQVLPANRFVGTAVPTTRSDEEGSRLNVAAHALMKEGRYQEAIPLLDQSIKSFPDGSQHPSRAYAIFNLAQSLRKTGKPEQAIPLLEKCLQMESQNELFLTEMQTARQAVARKHES